MSKTATIILNRNLPKPTNQLYEHISKYDGNETDIYVIEAGSDESNLSKYCKWHVNDQNTKKYGLRYPRGMNYALLKLYEEKLFYDYDSFFLLTNDTELSKTNTLGRLKSVLDDHPRVGILSPCSKKWGEINLIKEDEVKYFWFIHNNAFLLRRQFIEEIMEVDSPNYFNFIFDGSNFRGYFTESELIAKAYINNWSAAITTKAFAEENESYLLNSADLIKTENFDENLKLYISEGERWIKKKYGFNSRWSMYQYVRSFYDKFFEFYPEYIDFKI